MAIEQATPTTLQHISLARRGATYFEMSGPGEFIAAAVLFALMLVIRIVNILHYRFDSDEPQHHDHEIGYSAQPYSGQCSAKMCGDTHLRGSYDADQNIPARHSPFCAT
jgi:hypothetical protein